MSANPRISRKLLIALATIIVVATTLNVIILVSWVRIQTAVALNHGTGNILDNAQLLLPKLAERRNSMLGYVANSNSEFPTRIDWNATEIPPILNEQKHNLAGAFPAESGDLYEAVGPSDSEVSTTVKRAGSPSTLEATLVGIEGTAHLMTIREHLEKFHSAETAASHERIAQLTLSLSLERNAELRLENARLKVEIQLLRDKIAQLKSLPPRAQSRPFGIDKAIDIKSDCGFPKGPDKVRVHSIPKFSAIPGELTT